MAVRGLFAGATENVTLVGEGAASPPPPLSPVPPPGGGGGASWDNASSESDELTSCEKVLGLFWFGEIEIGRGGAATAASEAPVVVEV